MGSLGADGSQLHDENLPGSLKPIKKLSMGGREDNFASNKKFYLRQNSSILEDADEDCLDVE